MNELRQILEDAFSAAPPDSDTRELVGQALDILDTIPMEPLEMMARVERVRGRIKGEILESETQDSSSERAYRTGLKVASRWLNQEFPDAKE